ncbi:MAG: DUF1499 domain-containing protein, partial [Betaproteobacteria bacterium]
MYNNTYDIPTLREAVLMTNPASTVSFFNFVLSIFVVGCSGIPPSNHGVKDGRLAPCPDTLNCVSSQSTDQEHAIGPLTYSSSKAEAMA